MIRDLGEKIRGFNHREWINKRDEIMKIAHKRNFSDPGVMEDRYEAIEPRPHKILHKLTCHTTFFYFKLCPTPIMNIEMILSEI